MSTGTERGGALLAVLWLSAALAAIAFSVSNTVRGETDRASTVSDGLKAYHLAAGAVQLAALEVLWESNPGIFGTRTTTAIPRVMQFATGVATVEMIPEAAKLNLNGETPEGLFRLLRALGTDPARATEIAAAIQDWRTVVPPGTFTQFDQFYLVQTPSFRASHASFQETEELLMVKGVTPDLYYGTWIPVPDAPAGQRLAPRAGLRDCLSPFGSAAVDVNTARPEVLLAVGVPPDVTASVMQRRRLAPFTAETFPDLLRSAGEAGSRLRMGGNTMWTIRATAQLRTPDGRLGDLKRTVAALVKYMPPGYDSPMHILRWYDTAWSN
jgi:general secretion pathway protein K